jgi:hypothetical protein
LTKPLCLDKFVSNRDKLLIGSQPPWAWGGMIR